MTVFTAVAAIGALTFVLAFLLSVANRRLRVFEDPRIDVVEEMLRTPTAVPAGIRVAGPSPRPW
jgi:Na+-translocating ferredoxin:NAD+ oxidoreductase RNF subunit RnfB